MTDPPLPPTTDGLVLVRAPEPGDAQVLIAGRDEEFRRWLGPGPGEPQPVACIHVVGWADYDTDQEWLQPGEATIWSACPPAHQGQGYEARAARLVTRFLRDHTGARQAPLVIGTEATPGRCR